MLFDLPWLVWMLLCLIVAAIYAVLWPKPKTPEAAARRPRWVGLVLRWFHSLVWLLLALACLIMGLSGADGEAAATGVAVLAGLCYGIFLLAFIYDRARSNA